ncbi:hypothetical protein NHX12_028943 [Muraenolepis orangiensis]|uniref:Uncharacterized protein n=1 Tax=Muraenolepis orangiensis TaxID=630683 RepID=A0A9Q0EGU0_9TELE|nr:hypothetical protein NHX12_028943 [Muraenolepis orangiensis]
MRLHLPGPRWLQAPPPAPLPGGSHQAPAQHLGPSGPAHWSPSGPLTVPLQVRSLVPFRSAQRLLPSVECETNSWKEFDGELGGCWWKHKLDSDQQWNITCCINTQPDRNHWGIVRRNFPEVDFLCFL